MKDVFFVLPIFVAGVAALFGASEASIHRPDSLPYYLLFLGFLFGLLLFWHRGKARTSPPGAAGLLRDVVVVAPVFAAGSVALFGMSEATWRHPDRLPFYLLFLVFLFTILVAWYRGRWPVLDRPRPAPVVSRPEPRGGAERAFVVVGAGVPLGSFALAWLASLSSHESAGAAWFGASAVGVTAVLCSTYLLSQGRIGPPAANPYANGKTAAYDHDPDAFDVVGRRG